MGIFDRWFGKRSSPKAEPEPKPDSKPEPPAEPAADTTVVPPGHKVETFRAPDDLGPRLSTLGDSVCVATLGHASDEPVEELENLLRQFEPGMWDPQRPARVARVEGPVTQLFAPANPSLRTIPRLLLWVFNRSGLECWLEDPARLQVLLSRLYRLENASQPITQFVYFERDCGPGAIVMARLLAGLGLNVQQLQPDPQRIFLVKVYRPEGITLIGLVGDPIPLGEAVDTFPTAVNAEKARAEAQGDALRLWQHEQREREALARVLQPLQPHLRQSPLLRAPRMYRLLRAFVDQGSPTARRALEQELLRREQPLLLLMRPDGKSTFVAEFPHVGRALRAYPDLASIQLTVKDLGLPPDAYRIAGVPARDVFNWGAAENLSVALNVYMTAHTPTYVFWSPEDAKQLAQGQIPTEASAAEGSVGPEAGDSLGPERLGILLSQIDDSIEQGIYPRAFELLRRIFSVDPENLDAHERAYRIYTTSRNAQESFNQLLNVLRLCTRRSDVQRAQPYLAILLKESPQHPEVPAFLAALRPGGRPFPQA
jgi:hypothetical protein